MRAPPRLLRSRRPPWGPPEAAWTPRMRWWSFGALRDTVGGGSRRCENAPRWCRPPRVCCAAAGPRGGLRRPPGLRECGGGRSLRCESPTRVVRP